MENWKLVMENPILNPSNPMGLKFKQAERLTRLNHIAIQQMRILVEDRTARRLEDADG
jgi:hypothetical protein